MTHIVLIGAGSAQFGFDTLGDVFSSETLKGSTITLLDTNPTALAHVSAVGEEYIKANNLSFTLIATTNRQEALKGANFVVVSIEVGDRFKLWDQDRNIPRQFGIRQVYGENGGPGGLFHALRIIPPILEICEDVRQICPNAYIFNYSNPMSRICTTVYKKFPELNFVGLCHEIASLEKHLPAMLGVDFDDLELTAGGLNHFSCLLKAKYKASGLDAYGDIRKKARSYYKTTPSGGDYFAHAVKMGEFIPVEGERKIDHRSIKAAHEWSERRLFVYVLDKFDLLPITTDSHFGEYLSWAHEVSDHHGIVNCYRYYQMYLAKIKPEIDLEVRERLIPIIEGIISDQDYVEAAVNIPNRGYIRELPENMAVEVPAVINKDGITGVELPKLPAGYAGILQNQIAIHNMTAEAVLTKSKKAVIQALLVDPTVDRANCLEELVDVMLSLQKDHLYYFQDEIRS